MTAFDVVVATTTANVGKPGLTTTSVISSNQSPSTLDNFTPQSSSSTLVIQNETKALSSSNSDKGKKEFILNSNYVGCYAIPNSELQY